jgi:hypothetical protein
MLVWLQLSACDGRFTLTHRRINRCKYHPPQHVSGSHDGQAVIGEFDIYGVYFPAFAVFAAIAFALQLAMKRLLASSGVYSFVWHPALFDLAIYVILLAVVTAIATTILAIA